MSTRFRATSVLVPRLGDDNLPATARLANTASRGEEFRKFEWKYNISVVPRVTRPSGIISRELRDRSAVLHRRPIPVPLRFVQKRPVYEQRDRAALNGDPEFRQHFVLTFLRNFAPAGCVDTWNVSRIEFKSLNVNID